MLEEDNTIDDKKEAYNKKTKAWQFHNLLENLLNRIDSINTSLFDLVATMEEVISSIPFIRKTSAFVILIKGNHKCKAPLNLENMSMKLQNTFLHAFIDASIEKAKVTKEAKEMTLVIDKKRLFEDKK